MSDNDKKKTVPVINFRVTPEEYEIIKRKADKLGMTVSAFMRMVGINVDVEFKLKQ